MANNTIDNSIHAAENYQLRQIYTIFEDSSLYLLEDSNLLFFEVV